jgi:tellurite resistance protein
MNAIAMTDLNASFCTEEQVQIWLRGLLTLAWADGDFSEAEKSLIASVTHHTITPEESTHQFPLVTDADLKAAFGQDLAMADNFLRTAVMVALSDGVYSSSEDELLIQFCNALGTSQEIIKTLRLTLCDLVAETASPMVATETAPLGGLQPPAPKDDRLKPVRDWLDNMDIHDPKVARFLCKLIPSQCPFERDVILFGKKLVHIPPMCKINPLYEQLVGLRFRSLSYLADTCGEDITPYL